MKNRENKRLNIAFGEICWIYPNGEVESLTVVKYWRKLKFFIKYGA